MCHSPWFRLIWSALGVGVGISLALFLVAPPVNPFLLASLGGAAVLVSERSGLSEREAPLLIENSIGMRLLLEIDEP